MPGVGAVHAAKPPRISSMARRSGDPYSRDVHQLTYLSGQFLLAMPGMTDPHFDHAIIAMCAHDEGGALGIGVGATIDGIGFHALLDQFGIAPGDAPDAPVHYGGPVEPRRGFVLHSHDWQGQDSVDVGGRWVLSSTVDVLRAIAEGRGPERWIVALGYAGWDAGQLEGELREPGCWFNVGGEPRILYDVGAGARWQAAFGAAGVDPRQLVTGGGTA
ncbi:putative transcriptional regulator [Sphingomonas sp. SORGH_AS 950]|nr:putative transcriptional regulator [Sphingomonas sp. SORGH_AS_0950]